VSATKPPHLRPPLAPQTRQVPAVKSAVNPPAAQLLAVKAGTLTAERLRRPLRPALPFHPSLQPRSVVEVWTGVGSASGEFQRVYMDAAEITQDSTSLGSWWFRWATDDDAVSGVWQVSVFPFPTGKKEWQSPPGLVVFGTAPAGTAGSERDFTIDLQKALDHPTGAPAWNAGPHGAVQIRGQLRHGVQPVSHPVTVPLATPTATAKALTAGAAAHGATAQPLARVVRRVPAAPSATTSLARPVVVAHQMRTVSELLATLDRTLYVRIVPVDAQGEAAGTPSPDVTIRIRPAKQKLQLPRADTSLKVWIGVGSSSGEFQRQYAEQTTITEGTTDLKWWFEWQTNAAGAAAGFWQVSVSMVPFLDVDATNWKNPPGVVASGTVAGVPQGAPKEFQIDLANALSGGAKFCYVWIYPVDAGGNAVAMPSDTVRIDLGVPPTQFAFVPPKAVYETPPSVRLIKYAPIRALQPGWERCFLFVQEPPQGLGSGAAQILMPWYGKHKGDTFCFPPPDDKSFWDKLGDAVGSVLDAIASAVNWVSEAWQTIQNTVVNVVAALASALGIPCGEESLCHGIIHAAMETSLLALGVPPTIPNFAELSSMGSDYLISVAADEIGAKAALEGVGITPQQAFDMAKTQVQALQDQVNSGAAGGGFMIPAPQYQPSPAIVTVEVYNPAGNPAPSQLMGLSISDRLASSRHLWVPRTMPAPPLQPGQTLTVPIVLEEDVEYWKWLTQQGGISFTWEAHNEWSAEYGAGDDTLYVATWSGAYVDSGRNERHMLPDGWTANTRLTIHLGKAANSYQ
jgi:hypothetical protein